MVSEYRLKLVYALDISLKKCEVAVSLESFQSVVFQSDVVIVVEIVDADYCEPLLKE